MAERVAILPVESGLFALRYTDTRSPVAPKVFVRVSPSSENSVRLVVAPGREGAELSDVGDCLVVVAANRGALHVTVSTTAADGGLDAKIRLEKLMSGLAQPEKADGGGAADRAVDVLRLEGAAGVDAAAVADGDSVVDGEASAGLAPAQGADEDGVLEFRCLAHVARRGDVAVVSGEWIGGPTTPMRIEGLQLDWTPPPGLQIYYQVLVAGARGRWSAWVSQNAFAGSRGRALSLAGVRFRLEGVRAQDFEIRADAIVLGSSIESEVGAAVEFVSRTGNDPIVGLRVAIVRRQREPQDEAADASWDASQTALSAPEGAGGMDVDGDAKRRGRVRIFSPRRGSDGVTAVRKSGTGV